MSRTLKGNLTGKAAAIHLHEMQMSALEDSISLTELDHLEISRNVSRKMYLSCKKNGFQKDAHKYYMQAWRLDKKIKILKARELIHSDSNSPTPSISATDESAAICQRIASQWDTLPEVSF